MIRRRVFAAAVLTLTFWAPSPASAAVLTLETIGTFSWTEGPLGFSLSLQNDSALPGIRGDFTSVILMLGGGEPLFVPPESVGYGQSWSETFDSIAPALLSFSFNPELPAGATAITGSFFSIDLSESNPLVELQYSYLAADPPVDPPAPVPEPGSLLLLGAGLAAAAGWRRFGARPGTPGRGV